MTTPNNEPLARKWIKLLYDRYSYATSLDENGDVTAEIGTQDAIQEHNAIVDLLQAEREKRCKNCVHFSPYLYDGQPITSGQCALIWPRLNVRPDMRCPDHELKQD